MFWTHTKRVLLNAFKQLNINLLPCTHQNYSVVVIFLVKRRHFIMYLMYLDLSLYYIYLSFLKLEGIRDFSSVVFFQISPLRIRSTYIQYNGYKVFLVFDSVDPLWLSFQRVTYDKFTVKLLIDVQIFAKTRVVFFPFHQEQNSNYCNLRMNRFYITRGM